MSPTGASGEIPVLDWFRLFRENQEDCDFAYDFNARSARRIRDDVDLERFADALTLAFRSQEVTRVRVRQPDTGEWVMYDSGIPFPAIEVEDLPAGHFEDVHRDIVRPFSISGDILCRARVVRLGGEPWFFACRHHAFCDYGTHLAFLEEAVRAYLEPGWIPPADGYFEWARGEYEASIGPRGEDGRRFWSERAVRFADWPRSPRQDRDGSGVHPGDPMRLSFHVPWSGERFVEAERALGATLNALAVGAFVRAIASDHGADRAVAGWTCHGRCGRTRRIGGALLRDYDIGLETRGDARTFLRRVRADLNAAMRHPYGFAEGLVWSSTGGHDNDVAVVNILRTDEHASVFAPDPRAIDDGAPSDSSDLFELLLFLGPESQISEICVRYMPEYYSPERVADFVRRFADEMVALLREAGGFSA